MKRFLLILVFSVLALAQPVQGQDVPTLSDLEIAIWPEYDRPEVLVIYRGLFAADTPLPVPVEIYVPARVGQPTAVAYVDGGDRFNQQYTTRVEGDWLVVSFELARPGFQLEYYDTLPVDPDGQRTYTFDYTADYPVSALSLDFQAPPTAESFSLEPPADSVVQEADGLTYHLVQTGPLEQNETSSWTVTYRKDNPDLTVSLFAPPEATAPAALPSADTADNSTVVIFFIAFVALVAVGAAAFWLGRRTQPLAEPEPPRGGQQKRRGSGRGAEFQRQQMPSPVARDGFFCPQCGTELRSDADFCHRCGTAVRRE